MCRRCAASSRAGTSACCRRFAAAGTRSSRAATSWRGDGAGGVRERRVALDRRELASHGRGRALLVRPGRDQGVGPGPAVAGVQGDARVDHRRDAHWGKRARDAVRAVVPRRVDVFPRRDEGGCERPAAARPTRIAPRAGCRLSLGRRRARRAPVTTPTRHAAALVALGAALLAASYPPFRLPVLSFLALTPAVVLLRRFESERDLRGAMRWGFWYGFVTQGAVLYWLVVALWHFTPLSALGYLATIALFGLWHAVIFWLVVRVRLRLPAAPLGIVFPVVWTAVEWAVGHQGDIRFPWLGRGSSLTDASVLVQWADLAGARGVTLWLAWCNVMVVEGLLGNRERGT